MNYDLNTSNYSVNYNFHDISGNVDNNGNDVKSFKNILKTLFSRISPCADNSVLLLTNRAILIGREQEITNVIENSCIKLTVTLLGRNETNAAEFLKNSYKHIPNVTTINLQNYDCLSYLFYCLLPCSSNKPECMKFDVEDCQHFSKLTPNRNPDDTLHIWYILNFNNNTMEFSKVRDNIVVGLKNYLNAYNVTRYIIRLAYNIPYDTNAWWTLPIEDIDLIKAIDKYFFEITTGDVINDYNYLNNYTNIIPWSGTLIETRPGILSVIILTNYATKNLFTIKGFENLQGQMYIYNLKAYEYYSTALKHDEKFQLHSINFDDIINIYPISNEGSTATSVTSQKTFTESIKSSTTTTNYGTKILDTTTWSPNPVIPSKSANKILIIFGGIGAILIALFVAAFVIYWKLKRKQRNANLKALQHFIKDKKNSEISKNDEWELTWDKLLIENDELHTGKTAQLLHGKFLNGKKKGNSEENIEVAIKMPSKNALPNIKYNFLNEIRLMKAINGKNNIVKMFGCITTGDKYCLVLEYCSNYDLITFVRSLKYTKKEFIDIQNKVKKEFFLFAWQISHGLQYLCSEGIIHRDLTASNILIDSNKNAKITDFGLAVQNLKSDQIISCTENDNFATKWLAIEALKSNKFSFSSDIWAFGVILFEMYSFGETPYVFIETKEELLEYLEVGKRLEKPDFCSDELFEIMLECWMENPFNRPKCSELIKSFAQFLESSTEGYGYLEIIQAADTRNYKSLVHQSSSLNKP